VPDSAFEVAPVIPGGVLALSSSTYSVGEGDGTVTITVTRSGGSSGAASVVYTTGNGTAGPGSDYTATTGTLNWANNDSADKTFQVAITDDGDSEGDETFEVTLSGASGSTLGSPSTASVTIIDNEFNPSQLASLVGWYDAQALSGADGSALTTWPDTTDAVNNTMANNLTQVTSGVQSEGENAVAPTLQTISLNGYSFRSVRFLAGSPGDYELLKATNLVTTGDSTRSFITVYRGGINDPAGSSRISGFGSRLDDGNSTDKIHLNTATDGDGSLRFDGAFLAGHSAGLNLTDVLIRTTVMESKNSFDEYIDVLDGAFTDTQVLSNGNPSAGIVVGDFHLGDLTTFSVGGQPGAANFDVLEVLAFDGVLTTTDRQNVQDWLKTKYTTDPNPPLTPAESWRDFWFGQTANSGDAADDFDFDKDGMVNLLERAFGSNPTLADLDPSAAIPPAQSVVSLAGSDYLALTYRRLAGGSGTTGVDYTADGITYTVEYDGDLSDPWSTGSVTAIGAPIDNGDGTETVTVRLTTSVITAGKQFIRLRVVSAP